MSSGGSYKKEIHRWEWHVGFPEISMQPHFAISSQYSHTEFCTWSDSYKDLVTNSYSDIFLLRHPLHRWLQNLHVWLCNTLWRWWQKSQNQLELILQTLFFYLVLSLNSLLPAALEANKHFPAVIGFQPTHMRSWCDLVTKGFFYIISNVINLFHHTNRLFPTILKLLIFNKN